MKTQYPLPLHHDGSDKFLSFEGGKPHLGDSATIRLQISNCFPASHVLLRLCPDGEEKLVEMLIDEQNNWVTVYSTTIILDMPVINYRFLIFSQGKIVWYNAQGVFEHILTDDHDFRILTQYEPVDWVRDCVFYQIFPDRFFDGDKNNNVVEGEYIYRGEPAHSMRWGEVSSRSGRGRSVEFYGGDLTGIEKKLEYLVNLGINAIYLTPIFKSLSNHRYDVVDYYDVDEHLGGKSALISLREKTRQNNIRLILDIVPNHCGLAHPWFQDAQKSLDGETAEYFTFFQHPDDYACWLGVKSLPKFNYKSRNLRHVMFEGENSVFKVWLRPPFSVDGWRIDVANMLARQGADQLGLEIGRNIRIAVKSVSPETYLLGENFFDGSWQLQGDFLDANMNYSGFMRPVWFWLSNQQVWLRESNTHISTTNPSSTESMVNSWYQYLSSVPWSIALQQLNLLDSHDTDRIKTIVSGNLKKLRIAISLQFGFPGVPCIYYGDEIGLTSDLEGNRACMKWNLDAWDHDLWDFYQKIIALRKSSPALKHGGFRVLSTEGEMVIILRETKADRVIIIANRGEVIDKAWINLEEVDISIDVVWQDVMTGELHYSKDGKLIFNNFPTGALILRQVNTNLC